MTKNPKRKKKQDLFVADQSDTLSLTFTNSCYLKVTSLLLILSCHFCKSRRKDELKLVYYHNWWHISFSLGRCPPAPSTSLCWNQMRICSLLNELMYTLLCMAASLAVKCCKIQRSLCCLSTWHHIKHKEYQMTSGVTLNHSGTGPAGLKNFRAPLMFEKLSKGTRIWHLSWWDTHTFRIPQKQVSEECFLISSPLGSTPFPSVSKKLLICVVGTI